MSFCNTCLRFWRYKSKRWPNAVSKSGTCMLDGSKTKHDYSCGMHTDTHPPTSEKEVSPDKREGA